MQKLLAIAAASVVLLLALSIHPTIAPDQDAGMYLAAAHSYQAQGFRSQYPREPLFPLFMAALDTVGVPPARLLALVQNALFMAGLFFFLRSVLGPRLGRAEVWTAAALVTLIPTFLLTVNGAMYTESISCTLIFLMLGSIIRIFNLPDGSHGTTPPIVVRTSAWAVVAILASVSLALAKGAFLYVNVAFGLAGSAAAAFFGGTRVRRAGLAATFLGIAFASWGGTALWLASRAPRLTGFERGGVVFFGRVEFAARFDFGRQTLLFLVNALSESTCRRLYAGECAAYTFGKENDLGFSEKARSRGDEQALFAKGFRRIGEQPLRQLFFAAFELARFVLHHGTTGFATLDAPVLGPLFSGRLMTALLKLFNVLLYLVPPATLLVLRRRGRSCPDLWRAWPETMRFGAALCLTYSCLYLAVYGFATTAVRMVYPVAPFLILLDAQLIRTTRASARPQPTGR